MRKQVFRKRTLGCMSVCWVLLGVLASRVVNADWHVKMDGDDTNTGADWVNALATISNAVAKAGANDVILVSNGTYGVTDEILVDKGLTIKGLDAPEKTIVERTGTQSNRIFKLTHPDILLANLTIQKGYIGIDSGQSGGGGALSGGAGIFMTGGTVSNCVITLNTNSPGGAIDSTGYPYGGGVSMSGGTLWGCTVSSNMASGYGSYGQGVYMMGGTIRDSIVIGNRGRFTGNDQRKGAGICIFTGGLVTNTDIIANGGTVSSASQVGGLYYGAGTVVDCRVVSNVSVGVQLASGMVLRNCTISYTKSSPWGGRNVSLLGGGGMLTNCTVYGGVSAPGVDFASDSNLVVDCVISNEASGAFIFTAGKTNNSVLNGTIYNSEISLGNAAAANFNNGMVSGSDTIWNLKGKNLTVGTTTSTGNVMTITQSATVDNVGKLSVTGVLNAVELLGGTLRTTNIVYGDDVFTVGDGTQAATLYALGGTLAFPAGLVITNNAMLTGWGVIKGTTTVYGAVSPGATIGTVTNNGALVLRSEANTMVEMNAYTTPGAGWDYLVVTNGALQLDGTLTVLLIGGFVPTEEQSFIIMTNRGPSSVSGSFVNTPGLVPVYTNMGGKTVGFFRVTTGTQGVVLDSFSLPEAGTVFYIR